MSTDGWAELTAAAPESVEVGGRTLRRGDRVVLRPRTTVDVVARGLDGKVATIERIDAELDGTIIVSVVPAGDPARTLGKARFLGHRFFFAPDELEPVGDGADGAPRARILVAGIGNLFLGDDGFGVHAARRLAEETLPTGVDVVEFGIRGMDLAYALGEGYAAALLIDCAARGEPPGTLSVIDPDVEEISAAAPEGHGMDPVRVLALARRLGALPARTLIVACEPGALPDPDSEEIVAELSPPVAAAVERLPELVRSLVDQLIQSALEVVS
ncbi:MAG TPA: hydrogenase maturation protease [Candidatus Elarobacter sp.]|jgi:hydrogenase maturation protease|nr:hydrogenase maturation protease [Candidatus Elarobacter sp.]